MKKVPRQSRSVDTTEVILEAAVHILRERDLRKFTTRRVAERAGVSIGSLYQYFSDKEAILSELVRREFMQAVSRLPPPPPPGLPFRDLFRRQLHDVLQFGGNDLFVTQILVREAPHLLHSPAIAAHREMVFTRMREEFQSNAASLRRTDVAAASGLVYLLMEYILSGGIRDPRSGVSFERLTLEIDDLLARYLFPDQTPASPATLPSPPPDC